ncbi:hypothetical protein [Modestobacter muralis]|uniref:hypothetical protein n=1 Tax=Modestobacter muralis TaxID=1608614 RepID=UPI001B8C7A72|nr:hypothetical protein [Modestobacter muralis]
MARGDHPMRTPAYGGLLIAAAMVGATVLVQQATSWPGWLRTLLLAVAVVAMVLGALLTLRDRTPPRRPRGVQPRHPRPSDPGADEPRP